jgi:hypothetical protein
MHSNDFPFEVEIVETRDDTMSTDPDLTFSPKECERDGWAEGGRSRTDEKAWANQRHPLACMVSTFFFVIFYTFILSPLHAVD